MMMRCAFFLSQRLKESEVMREKLFRQYTAMQAKFQTANEELDECRHRMSVHAKLLDFFGLCFLFNFKFAFSLWEFFRFSAV